MNVVDITNDIFCKMFNVNSITLNEENIARNVLGEPFYLHSFELLLLFFEIEKVFNIHINEEFIVKKEFNTLKNIYSAVECSLETSSSVL